jgi:hypothetical protein
MDGHQIPESCERDRRQSEKVVDVNEIGNGGSVPFVADYAESERAPIDRRPTWSEIRELSEADRPQGERPSVYRGEDDFSVTDALIQRR